MKLDLVRSNLKVQDTEVFNDVMVKKQDLIQEIDCSNKQEVIVRLSNIEWAEHCQRQTEVASLLLAEEISCWQKSRALWLKERDQRTVVSSTNCPVLIIIHIPLVLLKLMGGLLRRQQLWRMSLLIFTLISTLRRKNSKSLP